MEKSFITKAKEVLDVIVFPFLTNLIFLIFICCSIDLHLSNNNPRIVIAFVGIFIWYLHGLIQFISYGKCTGGWGELVGTSAKIVLVIMILITYPVFFLFWLPYIMYHLMQNVGTPIGVWQNLFQNTALNIENLLSYMVDSKSQLVINYIYIGIPFGLFSLIYIGILIFLSPLWYFLFSPLGMSSLGISMHVTLHFPNGTEGDLQERIEKTSVWGTFWHVIFWCTCIIILDAIHIAIIGVTWYNIALMVFAGLNFLVSCYTSVRDVICTSQNYIDEDIF